MQMDGQVLRLRVRCLRPPDPARHDAEFGLQEKRRGDWILHPGQRQSNGDVIFECECRVKVMGRGQPPDFSGQFIQGKRGERFLYLSWKPRGWRAGEPEPAACVWVRRMKIHLRTITSEQIEKALRSGGVLEATVVGTANDGGPACASVPLIGGEWKVHAGQ